MAMVMNVVQTGGGGRPGANRRLGRRITSAVGGTTTCSSGQWRRILRLPRRRTRRCRPPHRLPSSEVHGAAVPLLSDCRRATHPELLPIQISLELRVRVKRRASRCCLAGAPPLGASPSLRRSSSAAQVARPLLWIPSSPFISSAIVVCSDLVSLLGSSKFVCLLLCGRFIALESQRDLS